MVALRAQFNHLGIGGNKPPVVGATGGRQCAALVTPAIAAGTFCTSEDPTRGLWRVRRPTIQCSVCANCVVARWFGSWRIAAWVFSVLKLRKALKSITHSLGITRRPRRCLWMLLPETWWAESARCLLSCVWWRTVVLQALVQPANGVARQSWIGNMWALFAVCGWHAELPRRPF